MRVRIMAEPGDGMIRVLTRNDQGQESVHVTVSGGDCAEVDFDGDHEVVISTGGREAGQPPLDGPPTPRLLGAGDDGPMLPSDVLAAAGGDATVSGDGEEVEEVEGAGGGDSAAGSTGEESVAGGGEESTPGAAEGGGEDSVAGGAEGNGQGGAGES